MYSLISCHIRLKAGVTSEPVSRVFILEPSETDGQTAERQDRRWIPALSARNIIASQLKNKNLFGIDYPNKDMTIGEVLRTA